MKAAIYTLGCKVNQYESQQIRELLERNGYLVTEPGLPADVYIVNSCTVTAESTRKSLKQLRHYKRLYPDCVTVLAGCAPQAFPAEVSDASDADIVIGNKEYDRLPGLIDLFLRRTRGEAVAAVLPHARGELYEGAPVSGHEGHTRAFLKIQDGCSRFCTYCAIPYAKGFSRSKSLDDVKSELAGIGGRFREVVLIGINLSSFGQDIGADLGDAVLLAQETPGVERIRLGSLEPDHMTPALREKLSRADKLCPQFHLSLQSGSDSVLRRMNRHYTAAEYLALTEALRREFPGASVTTDVIVGFPGETDADFAETRALVEAVGFEKVHVFPFSPRSGTPAAKMPDQIAPSVKAARAKALAETAEQTRLTRFSAMLGSTARVLFETPEDGFQTGYTENYTPVRVRAEAVLTGQILPVTITAVIPDAQGAVCEARLR